MSEKKKISPLQKALMAGALMAGGCNSAPDSLPQNDIENVQPNIPEPTIPELVLPKRYQELGPDRLQIHLEFGGHRFLLTKGRTPQEEEATSSALAREVEKALRHPERYEHITLSISDALEELPICNNTLEIPENERTREGMRQRLWYVLQDMTAEQAMAHCNLANLQEMLQRDPRLYDEMLPEQEPIDYRHTVSNEVSPGERSVLGRTQETTQNRNV